jgi:hypothetical protein
MDIHDFFHRMEDFTMSRILRIFVVAISLMVGGIAQASNPPIAGKLQGLELAQQTPLNPAVFVGVFAGKVGGNVAFGAWAAGVQHEIPLPAADGESVAIRGEWQLQVWVLQGFRLKRVSFGGPLVGDLSFFDTDLFTIDAVMSVTSGGSGNILLRAILDHTVFPPGVSGTLSQP